MTAEPRPYEGQLLIHELYRVTLSDRSRIAARVNEAIVSETFDIDSDGREWWTVDVPGKRGCMTKDVFGWIERYLRRTYALRHRGGRQRFEDRGQDRT